MAQKPAIPKGTRDFLPLDVARRTYIFDTIKKVFRAHGFGPIETPSFELSTTLLGKYGEEGDRLIFRILNSGDYMKNYSKFLRIHVTELFTQAVRSKIYDDSNLKIRLLFKESFLQELIDDLKKRNVEGLNEFYSKQLFDLMKLEVQIIKSDTSMMRQLIDIVKSCTDCDPLENPEIKKLINDSVDKLLGKWYSQIPTKYLTQNISEKALRYDLTVPFARFVVQHQNELSFPFKRYQIQPVWRADRPQHGRYQEFYQCDADVVGSDSLLYEVDLVQIFDEVLTALQIPGFTIKINNRKILSGIAEISGESDKLIDITVAIDKLDKIGIDGVVKELREKGVSESAIDRISPLFELSGDNESRIAVVKDLLKDSETGLKGIEELEFVLRQTKELGTDRAEIEFDVTLARGLNYYTGAIFEVKVHNVKMGSICGGGRYDDLTGLFGLSGLSGVGISFGADRIYDVLLELNLFPEEASNAVDVLFTNFGDEEVAFCMKAAKDLRKAGIDCEVYPSAAKMKKQMKYADDTAARYVALVGENELKEGKILLKNMQSGEQTAYSVAELIAHLSH